MSSIGSIGSSSLWYLQYAQNAAATGQTNCATDSSSSAPTSSTTGTTSSASGTPTDASDLRSQLETAVTNAISNLSSTSTPGDVLQAVGGAINSTLQSNGVNPQQFHAHGHHGHHHVESSQDTLGSSSTNDEHSDDSTNGSDNSNSLTGSSASSQTPDLLAILLQIGSQSTQPGSNNTSSDSGSQSSQTNTLASLLGSSTSNGNVDLNTLFAQLFANFPAGSGLNVQA